VAVLQTYVRTHVFTYRRMKDEEKKRKGGRSQCMNRGRSVETRPQRTVHSFVALFVSSFNDAASLEKGII